MTGADPSARYNYDAFVPAKFEPWLNFAGSPPLGEPGPDFPLWPLDGGETRLSAICATKPTPSWSSAASPDRIAGHLHLRCAPAQVQVWRHRP